MWGSGGSAQSFVWQAQLSIVFHDLNFVFLQTESCQELSISASCSKSVMARVPLPECYFVISKVSFEVLLLECRFKIPSKGVPSRMSNPGWCLTRETLKSVVPKASYQQPQDKSVIQECHGVLPSVKLA